jgi:hypothetical protein
MIRLSILALMALCGCVQPAVEWSDARLVREGESVARATAAIEGWTLSQPGDPALCTDSFRAVRAGDRAAATWWRLRPDGSVAIVAAWSSDSGRSWDPAVMVDSLDRADVGCARPAPAIAATGGDVHVAYSMHAPEGTGVFFSHAMDAPGMRGIFHSPSAVIYGDRLVPVGIAVAGNRVAVAYEEPSGNVQRIGLAVSSTQGHPFQARMVASPTSMRSRDPAVEIRGDSVILAWRTEQGARVVRSGTMK